MFLHIAMETFQMLNRIAGTLLVSGLLLIADSAWTTGLVASESPHAASVGPVTAVPYGWLDFCGRRPNECHVSRLPASNVKLTSRTWDTLERVNRGVNASIQPVSNLEHWGTILDHWDYPVDGKGDCKIYALQKRRLLMSQGFPRQALLMTIVRESNGEGHTILTVKTDHGDYILDNLVGDIRPWDETGYQFIKRQSQENPNVWLSFSSVNAMR
jgi:predicted transglutaminase-like cysteine proteinase